MGWLQRLQDGLTKTRKSVQGSLRRLISSGPDQAVLEEVEEALLSADVGVRVVDRLLEQIRTEGVSTDSSDPLQPFKDTLVKIFDAIPSASLEDLVRHGPRPYVLLAIGINGVGKTTTVAKLGKKFQQANLQPLFVAADTFRAAATEQLLTWGNRIGIEVIRHQQGADPAAVVYDGMAAAKSRKSDVVLIDTAGRQTGIFDGPFEGTLQPVDQIDFFAAAMRRCSKSAVALGVAETSRHSPRRTLSISCRM